MILYVGGVVADGGVPGDGDGLAGELERDGPLDGAGGAVVGPAGAEDLLEVSDILQVHSRRLPAEVEITNPSRGLARGHPGRRPPAPRTPPTTTSRHPNRDQQGVTEAVTAAASHKIPGACPSPIYTEPGRHPEIAAPAQWKQAANQAADPVRPTPKTNR